MSEQYLIDTKSNTVGIVLDPETYKELVQAREELDRIRAAQTLRPTAPEPIRRQHRIREFAGLVRKCGLVLVLMYHICEERDSWDG